MFFGLETVVLTKRQEAEQVVAKRKRLWCSLGVTRMVRIRNDHMNEDIKVAGVRVEDAEDRIQ